LKGMKMSPPHDMQEWRRILEELVKQNGGGEQWLYLQVTRGMELIRNYEIPKNLSPTIFAISYPKTLKTKDELAGGIKVTTVSDIRWKYCHIKTTSRLAYVLMYQEALESGFEEAIIINNGLAL